MSNHPLLQTPATLCTAMALLALATPLAAQDGLTVIWKGKTLALQDIEGQLPGADAIEDQIERYSEWIEKNEYHVALSQDGRVILITESSKHSKRRLKLVESTLKSFDGLMSPPDRSESDETFVSASWGLGQHEPDSEPVVLIEVKNEEQYHELCARLGALEPNLRGWANSMLSEPGFAEEQVSAAAWQAAPEGYELGQVWRPENELVNRLSRLLLNRSFGPQPTWLRVASAWRVEMDVMGSIYCFPYRQGFVGIGDHGGWENELKRSFKERKKSPLEHKEFAGWKRNTWSPEHAQLSWGFVEFLARHKPEILPAVAEEFRLLYKAGSLLTEADGSWRTNPGFQVSVDAQYAVLVDNAGEGLFEEASEFLRSWKRYKPKKAKRVRAK